MAQHRAAHITSQAIRLAHDESEFQLSDLKEEVELKEMPVNSTFRLILRQLEDDEWLSRNHSEGRTWYAGPLLTDD